MAKKKEETKKVETTTPVASDVGSLLGAQKIEKSAKKAEEKAAKKEQVEFAPDFQLCINLSIVRKAIEKREEHLKEKFNLQAREILANGIKETGALSKGFTAISGAASANYRLQQKAFGFSKKTAEFLESKKIPFVSIEKSKSYEINPEVLANPALVEKLAAALKNLKGFEGISIIQEVVETKYNFNESTFAGLATLDVEEVMENDLLDQLGATYYVNQSLDGIEGSEDGSVVSRAIANLADCGFLKIPEKK
jgi:hypothetical protein